jgi:opacity protein-like surface antigen
VGPFFGRSFFLSGIAAVSGISVFTEVVPSARAAGPAYAWTGCYAGAQAGAATSGSHWAYTNSNAYSALGNNDPQVVPGANFSDNRGVVGLQAGCNKAIADSWVAGIEGSWITNPMNNQNNNGGFTPGFDQIPNFSFFNYQETITTKIQSIYSLTGRLGLAPSPDWLLYAKGGFAVARIETEGRVSPTFYPAEFDFDTRAWHVGWTAGAGVEYRLFRNVTVGAEYNYYSFANVTHAGTISAIDFDINGVGSPANRVRHDVKADAQTLMARVNFGLGGREAASGPYGAYAAYLKAPPPAVAAGQWSAFTTNEVKYSSWTGSRGANIFAPERGSGYQVYSPTTIGINYNLPSEYKFETRLKGGYVYSSQNTPGQFAHYEGPVDTQASFNLTLLNFDNIRPLLGLAMNLPTGNSYLPGNQRFTRMDPDLVDVGSYGAGFNINPTAGFIVGLNQTTALSLSAGYAFQGDFTKEGISITLTPDGASRLDRFDLKNRVDPGDTFTANGNISTSFGSLVLIASFAYMAETRVVIDGVAGGRSGARFTSNGTATYQFDDRLSLEVNVSWNFAEKNEIVDLFGNLITEPKNSNSHVVIASIEPTYRVTDNLRVGVNYSFLYRNANYYDQLQDQFVPAKQKHSVGASATYALTQTANLTFRGSHAWIKQEDSAFLVTTLNPPPPGFAFQPPALKYESWAASIAANMSF